VSNTGAVPGTGVCRTLCAGTDAGLSEVRIRGALEFALLVDQVVPQRTHRMQKHWDFRADQGAGVPRQVESRMWDVVRLGVNPVFL
jgi:hypothetical protein